MTAEQYARLAEYVQEMKDCRELCGQWTAQEWEDYNDEWIDCDNNFNGYVKNGGDRPERPPINP